MDAKQKEQRPEFHIKSIFSNADNTIENAIESAFIKYLKYIEYLQKT